jgi:hypothetical protein
MLLMSLKARSKALYIHSKEVVMFAVDMNNWDFMSIELL